MKVTFIFIRHGQGCHNIISDLYKKKLIRLNDALDFTGQSKNKELALIDPELTTVGINMTKKNAGVLKKVLEKRNVRNIDLFLSSGLIRTIETAYYTKKIFGYNDKMIYPVPFLREIDESSKDPKSKKSREVIDTIPSYAMKSLSLQKKHLEDEGILKEISFDYLDPTLRHEPGDINDFVHWFLSSELFKRTRMEKRLDVDTDSQDLTVMAFTHAGVLSNFTHEGFYNNSGFILNLDTKNPVDKKVDILLKDMKKEGLFTDYGSIHPENYCELPKCGQLCSKMVRNTM
jgi:hypothetical protein